MKRDTRILRAGREPEANFGILNPPVCYASTNEASSLEDRKYRADNRYEEGVFPMVWTEPGIRNLQDAAT